MNKFFEGVGVYVTILLIAVFIFLYVLPSKSWYVDNYGGQVCNSHKNWFEWIDFDKETCFKIPNNL